MSGCHDSQTQAGGLLLESGASYANLVNVAPTTPAAAALGWQRIDAANGDPATSFMFHKLTGDLPDPSFGERMPLGPPASSTQILIDVIGSGSRPGRPRPGLGAGHRLTTARPSRRRSPCR